MQDLCGLRPIFLNVTVKLPSSISYSLNSSRLYFTIQQEVLLQWQSNLISQISEMIKFQVYTAI